jgi:hypothetical protein
LKLTSITQSHALISHIFSSLSSCFHGSPAPAPGVYNATTGSSRSHAPPPATVTSIPLQSNLITQTSTFHNHHIDCQFEFGPPHAALTHVDDAMLHNMDFIATEIHCLLTGGSQPPPPLSTTHRTHGRVDGSSTTPPPVSATHSDQPDARDDSTMS